MQVVLENIAEPEAEPEPEPADTVEPAPLDAAPLEATAASEPTPAAPEPAAPAPKKRGRPPKARVEAPPPAPKARPAPPKLSENQSPQLKTARIAQMSTTRCATSTITSKNQTWRRQFCSFWSIESRPRAPAAASSGAGWRSFESVIWRLSSTFLPPSK